MFPNPYPDRSEDTPAIERATKNMNGPEEITRGRAGVPVFNNTVRTSSMFHANDIHLDGP